WAAWRRSPRRPSLPVFIVSVEQFPPAVIASLTVKIDPDLFSPNFVHADHHWLTVHCWPASKRDRIIEVIRRRLAACDWLFDLRLDRQAHEFLTGLLAGLDPSGKPVLGAVDVDAAAIVAVIVLGFLVALIEQHAPVRIVVFHFHLLLLAPCDDPRWRAKASGDFLQEAG